MLTDPRSPVPAVAHTDATADPPRRSETQWTRADAHEREALARRALATDAGRQLDRCFGPHGALDALLRASALLRLADKRPVDPNDPDAWLNADAHATAVLRRHDITDVKTTRLELHAIRRLARGQTEADGEAGLDWSRVTTPFSTLDDALRQAHAALPIDLDNPATWLAPEDRQRALAQRLGIERLDATQDSHLSHAHLDALEADDLRCWLIA